MESGGGVKRSLYLTAGITCVGLGYLGMLVPVMPSTIFFILALACFSKSSAKLEHWLLHHPWFGETLRNWRGHGTISIQTKRIICVVMGVSLAITALTVKNPYVIAGVTLTLGCVLAFILTRPSTPRAEPNS